MDKCVSCGRSDKHKRNCLTRITSTKAWNKVAKIAQTSTTEKQLRNRLSMAGFKGAEATIVMHAGEKINFVSIGSYYGLISVGVRD